MLNEKSSPELYPAGKDNPSPMKKVLMLASVASMLDQFNMPNIDILINEGYRVHVAANFEDGNTSSPERVAEFKKELEALGVPYYQIDFSRKITDVRSNIRAYRRIKSLMLENDYSFVHCHSPIGGFCGRLAGRATGTKVIYTAHGFHFFKGAPLINWLLYYPIERFLARYTDVLITINKEDYAIAQRFKAKKVEYVPGVGVDTQRFTFSSLERTKKRMELGIGDADVALLSVGELIVRKNHESVVRALVGLNNERIAYCICGRGELDGYLRDLAKKSGVEQKVCFLGFRRDIPELCFAADLFVFPSYQEGLPVALMEAMASGLPVICSRIRGNTDLIENGRGGYLVEPNEHEFRAAIEKMIDNRSAWKEMGELNKQLMRNFDVRAIRGHVREIYLSIIGK